MVDILTKEKRSRNMAAIRSKNTKPEIYIRKQLFRQGYRYRLNYKKIYGHPDLYLPKYHTAVFVHGCFWHRHAGCKYAYTPKSRLLFWQTKFNANVQRDLFVQKQLEADQIKCLIIWECTIKRMMKNAETNENILSSISEFLENTHLRQEL